MKTKAKEKNDLEAVLIKADGTIEKITLLEDEQEKRKQLQKAVGGYFDIITDLDGKHLIINESGLLQDLNENWYASLLIGQPNRLVGDVVVIDSLINVKRRLKVR